MTAIVRALLAELDTEALAELATLLAPHMPAATPRTVEDGWLDTRRAAEYAGTTPTALHKAMAARAVRFEQECPGGKAWFKRSDLDAWRGRSEGLRRAA